LWSRHVLAIVFVVKVYVDELSLVNVYILITTMISVIKNISMCVCKGVYFATNKSDFQSDCKEKSIWLQVEHQMRVIKTNVQSQGSNFNKLLTYKPQVWLTT
jgi:uncharacterized protein YjiK